MPHCKCQGKGSMAAQALNEASYLGVLVDDLITQGDRAKMDVHQLG
jgi:tRNA U34 5-carboxymethylaminomethyl modifying enzyme MnmG/GidA